jgi:hypothetical protein
VLSDQGKYDETRDMHRQVLKLMETVLGKAHSLTLKSMDNLAAVLGNQGKYEQAEEMLCQALILLFSYTLRRISGRIELAREYL